MSAMTDKLDKTTLVGGKTSRESQLTDAKIDPNALAGSKNSLGQESVRDGRPATDDTILEAMDEDTPATPALPDR